MCFKKPSLKKPSIEENIMKDFAEGRITVYEFWNEFNNNKELKNTIYNDKYLPEKNKPFLYENIDINILYHRCEIFRVVKVYFLRRNINLNFYNQDDELYGKLLSIVPSYITINHWFYDNILYKCPYEFKSKEWKDYIKNEVKINYKYKKYSPRWLQGDEWPIVKGKPAIFVKQNMLPHQMDFDDFEIKYYFIDEDNNEIVVKQNT